MDAWFWLDGVEKGQMQQSAFLCCWICSPALEKCEKNWRISGSEYCLSLDSSFENAWAAAPFDGVVI